MPTEADVRALCLAITGVTQRTSWGRPAWFARTLMARMWDDDVVTLKTQEREALAGTDPDTFYWTDHHAGSPELVLVRLSRVAPDELAEMVSESHRLANAKPRR